MEGQPGNLGDEIVLLKSHRRRLSIGCEPECNINVDAQPHPSTTGWTLLATPGLQMLSSATIDLQEVAGNRSNGLPPTMVVGLFSHSLNYCNIADVAAISCPIVGLVANMIEMESAAENPHNGDGHIQSDYVSPTATKGPQVQPSAKYAAAPPPVTRNHRPHGVRSGPSNEYRAFHNCSLQFRKSN
ncbi:hypothetical protein CTI12_AA030710 [Artemisia annua]|uniref:Uncharacterized protein n=1 Tax=Artemisia annua TaxID=35608 RepID=A0A2U1Q2K3_ARTAN|nr:hypothetical protein CTI12_AA030710 [Artemisia annua]